MAIGQTRLGAGVHGAIAAAALVAGVVAAYAWNTIRSVPRDLWIPDSVGRVEVVGPQIASRPDGVRSTVARGYLLDHFASGHTGSGGGRGTAAPPAPSDAQRNVRLACVVSVTDRVNELTGGARARQLVFADPPDARARTRLSWGRRPYVRHLGGTDLELE
jgi:hypothetical protein